MNDARLLYQLQQEIERLKTQIETGRWVDWTPTITQSGNVTYTLTGGFARYILDANGTITARARLSITGSGTTGNAITIGGLPYDIADVTGDIGSIRIVNTGTASYVGSANIATATSFIGYSSGNASAIGVTPNFALASGDVITFSISYEMS